MASGARPAGAGCVVDRAADRAAGRAPAGADGDAADAVLRRLRWRARRGMLENDLLLERFLDRHAAALGPAAIRALAQLLDLPDGDLLDLLLGRAEPDGALAGTAVRDLLGLIRAA
jgi:antitoxin CptB